MKILFVLVFCLFVNNAHSSIITFNDRATFEATTSATTQIDFNQFSAFGFLGNGTTYTENGLTFTSNGTRLTHADSSVYSTPALTSSALHLNSRDNQLIINFNTAVFSVGFEIGNMFNWGNVATPTTEIILGSNTFQVNTPNLLNEQGSLSFFGLQSDTAFTTLTISNPQQGLLLDDMAFNSSSSNPVPEPTSLALLALGLAGFGFSRKKKKI